MVLCSGAPFLQVNVQVEQGEAGGRGLPDSIGTLHLEEPGQLFPTESGRCAHLNGTSDRLFSRETLTVSSHVLRKEEYSVADESSPIKG